jgi:hypothetical protein
MTDHPMTWRVYDCGDPEDGGLQIEQGPVAGEETVVIAENVIDAETAQWICDQHNQRLVK